MKKKLVLVFIQFTARITLQHFDTFATYEAYNQGALQIRDLDISKTSAHKLCVHFQKHNSICSSKDLHLLLCDVRLHCWPVPKQQ